MGSTVRIVLITPLLGLVLAAGILLQTGTASAWSIITECDENAMVIGEIDVPIAGSFEIFVTDHVSGSGDWLEIPGSRQEITVVPGKEGFVSYGPLNIDNLRPGANTIRVEQTATPEKSASFKPCQPSKVTPTSTATRVPSETVSATPTTVVVETSTPAATATVRKTPRSKVSATPSSTATPLGQASSDYFESPKVKIPVKVASLPQAGTGNKDEFGDDRSEQVFIASVEVYIIAIILTIAGVLVYLRYKESTSQSQP